MNQENYTETIAIADTALENENYAVALEWFQKVLKENPEDLYALSRAGSVCIAMEQFEEAFGYFQKALEIQPGNGDNAFNLGNAYFFEGNYGKALEFYAEAEMKGCSEEVVPKLYYQKALLCGLRNDVKAALLNFRKYEDTDKSGLAALNPDVISEKLRLYMMAEDYDSAAKAAVQWIGISPGELRPYMVYFNILMADKKYDLAEKVLADAFQYVKSDENTETALRMEQAILYTARAEADSGNAETYFSQAVAIMEYLSKSASREKQPEINLSLMELCMKMKNYDRAISIGAQMLSEPTPEKSRQSMRSDVPLDEATVDSMLQQDRQTVEGQLSDELGANAEIYYDENGVPFRAYPDSAFSHLTGAPKQQSEKETPSSAVTPMEREFRDRLYFTLLSCYLEKENYEHARVLAAQLIGSENIYYSYFGRYAEAFSAKQLSGQSQIFTPEQADEKYATTIAFFRDKMVHNADTHFAVIFRVRMCAEAGRFAEAAEIAMLLPEREREGLLEYIAKCREELE